MLYEVLLGGLLAWNIPLLMGFICLAGFYAYLIKRFTNQKPYYKQPILFFLAINLLYLAIGSPLSAISHLSFSLHMMQMSMLYFIIPPLLLLGIPPDLYRHIWKISAIKRLSRLCLPPRLALSIFSLLFLLYHLPLTLNTLSQYPVLLNGYFWILFILAFSMWWPIVSPDPNQRFSKEHMKRYAFLSGLLLMPACMFFIVNTLIDGMNNPFLTQYTAQLCLPSQTSSINLLPSPFNTKFDQLMAGTLMLGVHKFGIMLSFHLGNKLQEN